MKKLIENFEGVGMQMNLNKILIGLCIVAIMSSMIGNVCAVSEEGLVAYWSFDDGTAKDSAGNNDGTIYGAKVVDGISGKAMEFDGKDDYVTCGTSNDLSFPDKDAKFTFTAWIYPTKISGRNAILSKYDSTGYATVEYGFFQLNGKLEIILSDSLSYNSY